MPCTRSIPSALFCADSSPLSSIDRRNGTRRQLHLIRVGTVLGTWGYPLCNGSSSSSSQNRRLSKTRFLVGATMPFDDVIKNSPLVNTRATLSPDLTSRINHLIPPIVSFHPNFLSKSFSSHLPSGCRHKYHLSGVKTIWQHTGET